MEFFFDCTVFTVYMSFILSERIKMMKKLLSNLCIKIGNRSACDVKPIIRHCRISGIKDLKTRIPRGKVSVQFGVGVSAVLCMDGDEEE